VRPRSHSPSAAGPPNLWRMSTPSGGALAPGRFRLLLLALVLFIVGTAALPASGPVRFLEFVLLAGTLVIALLELRVPGQSRLVPIALASSVIFVTAVDHLVRLRHFPLIASILVAVFAAVVVWLAYASVMRPDRSVSDRIIGAICVYLLIGLAWASLFETLDFVIPGSFRFPADTAWATPGTVRYRYLSFVTLATLGYGDVTPQTALAGTLAALEAVTGQLYIGITVARLVALSLGDRAGRGESSKTGV
jgi:voltage-gated potassium channel